MKDLNKPATAADAGHAWHEQDFPPRWYLWEGGFLVLGKAGGEVPDHMHHAIQVHVAMRGGSRSGQRGGRGARRAG